jgi:hypothetical protein
VTRRNPVFGNKMLDHAQINSVKSTLGAQRAKTSAMTLGLDQPLEIRPVSRDSYTYAIDH